MAGNYDSLAQHLAALDAAAMAPPTPVPLVTGSAVVDIDGSTPLLYVTSGGTGGNEFINIVTHEDDVGGNGGNAQYIGQRVSIVLVTQTDPGDVVVVTVNGLNPRTVNLPGGVPSDNPANYVGSNDPGVILDYVGAAASFVWYFQNWRWDYAITNNATDTELVCTDVLWKAETVTLQSTVNQLVLTGHTDTVVNKGTGNIILFGLPTADPHVVGALWNSTGTLKVSAG